MQTKDEMIPKEVLHAPERALSRCCYSFSVCLEMYGIANSKATHPPSTFAIKTSLVVSNKKYIIFSPIAYLDSHCPVILPGGVST